ncbi:DUF5316 family protein [Paenibacillus lemnae]|uniref:DUF5316 domain-containing protein n=1 Tax=Paenibacillus lemnae TaxID=1330551 RepID=A0A848M3S3_PAELE|nr:DUF5316 family protein [Paenibacillus lemnae]NMO94742.1 DUF5316 domain-containing protein [Paenibacillus lemnae]
MKWILYLAAICLFIGGALGGAWTTGDQQRANYYSDSKEDRQFKQKLANKFFIAGALFLVVAGVIYLVR